MRVDAQAVRTSYYDICAFSIARLPATHESHDLMALAAPNGPIGSPEPVGLGNTIRVATCFSAAAQVGKAAT
jgi:hypothetical protein